MTRFADYFDASAEHRRRGRDGLKSWLCRDDADKTYVVCETKPDKALVVLSYPAGGPGDGEGRHRSRQPPHLPTEPAKDVDNDEEER